MVICHWPQYCFFRVPHAASRSTQEYLIKYLGGISLQELLPNRSFEHCSWELFCKIFGQTKVMEYFKFCIIRHPLEMEYSLYCSIKKDHNYIIRNPRYWTENGGFVGQVLRDLHEKLQTTSFSDFLVSRWSDKVYNIDPMVGDELLDKMDFIVRFENLQSDFKKALIQAGFEEGFVRELPPIPHTNKTPKDIPEYTEEAKGVLREAFGQYMEKWGYTFPWSD